MMSPDAASMPQAKALPLPPRVWSICNPVWPKLTSYPGCLIDRIAVDDDDFIDIVRHPVRQYAAGCVPRSRLESRLKTVGRFASWGSPSQILTNFAISRPSSR
jgi:hypothetical protein